MTFAVECIDHVEVFVRDLEAAVRWYADVLGLCEIRRWEPHPVMIGVGETKLALFQADADAKPLSDDDVRGKLHWYLVAWKVDCLGFERAQEHLRGLGIEFRGPIDHGIATSIYFQDLDGHPLEITCYER
jgi:catechol 2,3-dioxygenase-like lactoylglutathione lyase family enzyme